MGCRTARLPTRRPATRAVRQRHGRLQYELVSYQAQLLDADRHGRGRDLEERIELDDRAASVRRRAGQRQRAVQGRGASV